MNPSSVGNLDDTTTWPKVNRGNLESNGDRNPEKGEGVKEDENWEHLGDANSEDLSCNELIHQSFLLNNDLLVRDILLQTGIRVKNFVRFELGEQV